MTSTSTVDNGIDDDEDKAPMTFVALVDMATIVWKPDQPLKRYLGALKQILQESRVYEREGNIDMAFVFLVKVSKLIDEYLPTHPEWPNTSDLLRSQLQRESNETNVRITALRGKIVARYEAWEKRPPSATKARTSHAATFDPKAITLRQVQANGMPGVTVAPLGAPGWNARPAAARMPLPGEGDDEGLEPASPRHAPSLHHQAVLKPFWPPPQPTAPPLWSQPHSWTSPTFFAGQRQPQYLPSVPQPPTWNGQLPRQSMPLPPPIPPLQSAPSTQPHSSQNQPAPPPVPAPPAQTNSEPSLFRSGSLAGLPLSLVKPTWAKRIANAASAPFASLASLAGADSHESPSNDEEGEVIATTEGGQPLRTVIVPFELVATFEKMASANTRKKIETCGLLMGTLNRFTITHLLVPKQTGTSDTCTTTHEEEQMAFQEKHDLMTLGWIHTHPTQSCFMSSLDLHTHAGYQVMLAEAIAIVVAPSKEPSFGIFRLTDPPGLETIVTCDRKGVFHPHPDLPIYTDCESDFAHISIRKGLRLTATDMR